MVSAWASESASLTGLRADQIIAEIRRGATHRLGELLDAYRKYLHLLAKTQIDEKLRGRISASDLVQEAMLGAYRDFPQFQGSSEQQLLAWLRQILINRLHVFVQQHVLAQKRDVRREISLEQLRTASARSTATLPTSAILADRGSSPSQIAMRRENAVVLANYLAGLTPQHREIIELRTLRGLPFEQIARQMNRTTGAVRMLWLRAIRQLRERFEEEPAS
jgi:RNA polymerase sigma-70 factor (ECF subfamily)